MVPFPQIGGPNALVGKKAILKAIGACLPSALGLPLIGQFAALIGFFPIRMPIRIGDFIGSEELKEEMGCFIKQLPKGILALAEWFLR